MADFPASARVVVIGGGAVGCSVLYHLAKMGCPDAVLLEKNELTSGSTWHAAGNCPNFSASWTIMQIQSYSAELFRRLGEEADYPINYHVTGSVRLAHSRARMEEFRHVASMARHIGIEMPILSNEELRQLYPFLETHDLEGGLHDPLDGDIDPAQLTQALAKAARDLGAKVVRFAPVTGVERKNNEWHVSTPQGTVRCEYVVNAAGYRANEIGAMFGRTLPCVSLAHQYMITDEIPELQARKEKLPLLRDPDSSYYLRQEKDALLLGPYEANCRAHWTDASDPMPEDFSFQLYPDDLERLEWYIEDACRRVPILGSVGIKRVVNGPIPYAPDGNPLVGPMPGVPNAFEACVFTFGIVQSGGAGKICAEWILHGETETDSWGVDPRRFTDFATHDYAVAKAREIYSHEYAMQFPGYSWPAGRPTRTSPLYITLARKGAMFGTYGGFERADYFARPQDSREQPDGFQRPHWHEVVGEECRHVAEHAGVIEVPGFTRFEVKGKNAAAFLERLSVGGLCKPGRFRLVYFASPKGKTLTEMSLARIDGERFWLLGGAGAAWHDRDWLFSNLVEKDVAIEDLSSHYTAVMIAGPKSRGVMEALAPGEDFSNDGFGWLHHREIAIDGVQCRVVRASYTGELGWEIHVPVENAQQIHDRVFEAGRTHNIRDFGMFALDSMRLEKGYRSWKTDLSSDFSMFESGLENWLRMEKPDFIGREALVQESDARKSKPGKTFVALVLEEGAPGHDGEALYLSSVFSGDAAAGLVLAGGFGHRTGKSIAFAVVDPGHAEPGTKLEIEIVGKRRGATVQQGTCLYDPDNLKPRA